MNMQEMSNVAKQILILFNFTDKEIIDKIPKNLIEHLQRLAIDSNINFKYESDKSLDEQDILEETKDLLAAIFYSYIADGKEKEKILKTWNDNENKYNEIILNDYNLKFETTNDNTTIEKQENALIENESDGKLYKKIKNIISRIFKR